MLLLSYNVSHNFTFLYLHVYVHSYILFIEDEEMKVIADKEEKVILEQISTIKQQVPIRKNV